MIDCLLLPASLSSLSWPCWTQICTFSQLWTNQWVESQLLSRLTPDWLPLDRTPPSTAPIRVDCDLHVHHQTRSISATQCISKVTRSRPRSASLSLLHDGFPLYLQTCSSTACKFTWSWPSKCNTKLGQSWLPSSHNHGVKVDLQTPSTTASECISKFTQLWPPSVYTNSHDYCLEVHMIMASDWISTLARSPCVELAELSWHPKRFRDKERFCLKECWKGVRVYEGSPDCEVPHT